MCIQTMSAKILGTCKPVQHTKENIQPEALRAVLFRVYTANEQTNSRWCIRIQPGAKFHLDVLEPLYTVVDKSVASPPNFLNIFHFLVDLNKVLAFQAKP